MLTPQGSVILKPIEVFLQNWKSKGYYLSETMCSGSLLRLNYTRTNLGFHTLLLLCYCWTVFSGRARAPLSPRITAECPTPHPERTTNENTKRETEKRISEGDMRTKKTPGITPYAIISTGMCISFIMDFAFFSGIQEQIHNMQTERFARYLQDKEYHLIPNTWTQRTRNWIASNDTIGLCKKTGITEWGRATNMRYFSNNTVDTEFDVNSFAI